MSAFVGFNQFPCSHDVMLGNIKWFCCLQTFFPLTWLIFKSNRIIDPLRSSTITVPSTLLQDHPSLCLASGTQALAGSLLERLSLHRGDRFPRSTQKPVLSSRLLHAGCRLGNKQVSPTLIPSYSSPSVLASSLRFRHVIKGSLAFVSLTLT